MTGSSRHQTEDFDEAVETLSHLAEKSRGVRIFLWGAIALIVVTTAAGVADFFAYQAYRSERELPFFTFEDQGVWWQYKKTPLGLVLLALELGPWLLAWLGVKIALHRLSRDEVE